MQDSIHTIIGLADTIKVINLTHTATPPIPLEWVGVIGVIVGATISLVGNYLLSRSDAKFQLKNILFQRRLDVYTKIIELSWEGYSVSEVVIDNMKVNYPQAYGKYDRLRKWLNTMVETMDKNRFLLDQSTYTKFTYLNWKLLEHINQLKQFASGRRRDLETRILGVSNVAEIQKLTEEFVDAARQYMNKKYDCGFEKVL